MISSNTRRKVVAIQTEEHRRAVIVATQVDLLEPLLVAAGFEVVGSAPLAVNGEQLVRGLRPDLVVVENDLVGETGFESIPHLREASPTTHVLLIVTEDWAPSDTDPTGNFAVATWNHLGELVDDLGDWVRTQHEAPAQAAERRSGGDRRVHQDWTRVGWERRAGTRRAR